MKALCFYSYSKSGECEVDKMRNDIILGMLPDVFAFADGTRVQSVQDWEKRRQEIKDTAISLEYGGMPPAPDAVRVERLTERGKGAANCYRVHCMIDDKDFTFCFMVHRPKEGEKCPVIVTGDSMYTENCNDKVVQEANRRGFAVVRFNRTEFAPDMYNSDRADGIYPFWPELAFSAISAWAWGYHRVIDALACLDYIDMNHIAVTGHSRGGKTVLLAGATDERIQYVNPNGSGAHGCGCYRFIQIEEEDGRKDPRSETLEDLFQAVPYWMGPEMRMYIGRENELPHDMHFIKALVAPRALLETNGYDDIWSNPRGSYLTHLAAKEVWNLYGNAENCQTWYREGGHAHGWDDFVALFDFLETAIRKKAARQTKEPYEDMKPLHEWRRKYGVFAKQKHY